MVTVSLTAAAAPQEAFAVSEAAVDALIAALNADSDAAMVAIFGEGHKELIIKSHCAATSATRAEILAAVQTLRVLREPSQGPPGAHSVIDSAERRMGLDPARRN